MPDRCYICGIELLPVPKGHKPPLLANHATKDHVPPKSLFCDPKPLNLITVPCCNKHNNKHSGVDERLRMLAALEVTRNAGGDKVLREKVFGSTMQKGRQPEFVRQIAQTIREGFVTTSQGRLPVSVFTVKANDILDAVRDVTKGLLAHFYPTFDYHGSDFMVIDFHSATLAKGNEAAQRNIIEQLVTRTQADVRGHANEFRFWRQVDEQESRGVWLLAFYEAVAFMVGHSKIPFETLYGSNRHHPPA
jgi:hypothetical protein